MSRFEIQPAPNPLASAAGDRQEGRRIAVEEARVSGQRPHRPDLGAADAGFALKVARTGRPPLPWTWEIVSENGKAGARRSMRAYPSAEDAWAAGREALAGLGRGPDPAR